MAVENKNKSQSASDSFFRIQHEVRHWSSFAQSYCWMKRSDEILIIFIPAPSKHCSQYRPCELWTWSHSKCTWSLAFGILLWVFIALCLLYALSVKYSVFDGDLFAALDRLIIIFSSKFWWIQEFYHFLDHFHHFSRNPSFQKKTLCTCDCFGDGEGQSISMFIRCIVFYLMSEMALSENFVLKIFLVVKIFKIWSQASW